jgi:hypothetical protein
VIPSGSVISGVASRSGKSDTKSVLAIMESRRSIPVTVPGWEAV